MSRYSRPKHFSHKSNVGKKSEFKHKDMKDMGDSKLDKINTPQEKAKVEKILHEYKEGKLKSSSGKTVTNKKQALAIALSEGRKVKDNPRATTKDVVAYNHKDKDSFYSKGSAGDFNRRELQSRKVLRSEPFHKDDLDMKFPYRTAILVPATKNGNEPISRAEHNKRVQETERFMAEKYGGYTAVKARGGYVGEKGKLIEEPVTEVVAYTDQQSYEKNKPAVRSFLQEKRKDWSQESIGYEDDKSAKLYYFKGK